MQPPSTGTTSAARAADVLLTFGRRSSALGVSQIARSTGVSKAVTHRIVTTFVQRGLLTYEPNTRRYRLGPAAATLGARALDASPLRSAAQETLLELQRETGETVTVSARVPGGRVYLDQVESAQEIKMTVEIGRRFDLHCGSSGRAILAFLPQADQEEILSRPLPRLTMATITDPDLLRAVLRQTRARGACHSVGERQEGAGSVAAPVLASDGTVIGSVSVCGPAYRMSEQVRAGLQDTLIQAAARVSGNLGHRPHEAPEQEA